ncbi:lipoyl(octanoyl) transferase LipB [Chitinophaga vietnamensis]|uniref:lipoyl(octanoyl) transferase LipB n=1 Tax=Chitinophaga vietnamensis TaxID=2593957 RepID=UPI001177FBE3|nr:lipoyl(octanoyl) transferase LipB [Chitinophaga vietnamensis]
MSKQQIVVRELGIIGYQEAWDYQEQLLKDNVQRKMQPGGAPTSHYLLFCEHPPVYTIGKSGHIEHLLLNEAQLAEKGIGFFNTNRGGDITFHGPGQIVAYPILDLELFYRDLGKYLRNLEEVVIRTLAEYGVKGDRSAGETGVWLDPQHLPLARKICAMGVRCSRWVTMHGFALNANTPLTYFDNIIPCGISGKQVAALNRELGHDVNIAEVKSKLVKHFGEVFEAEMITSGN